MKAEPLFHLTLTLTPGEREQQPTVSNVFTTRPELPMLGLIARLQTIPLLPKGEYVFSVVELVALRRVAPRPRRKDFPQTERCVRAVPPLHAAELSQRDNRYR